MYLMTKPACFVVFGKPGTGKTTLASQLAVHWKCQHINGSWRWMPALIYCIKICDCYIFSKAVVFKIISAFYFICNHCQVAICEIKCWNNFISHVTTSENISKLFWRHWTCWKIFVSCNKPLKLFWNNFSGWNNFEIISDVVTCEIKHWNNFETISVFYFTCNHWWWLRVKSNTKIISK